MTDRIDLENIINENDSFFVNVKFSKDKELKELNSKYFKRKYTTDVLSFGMNEKLEDGSYYLGDIIVNVEQAKKQAKDYNNNLAQEIAQLVEHGVLHLLGIHHDDDDEESTHGVARN